MSWKLQAAEVAGMLNAFSRTRAFIEQGHPTERILAWLDEAVAQTLQALPAPNSGPETSAMAARNMRMTKDSLRHKALAVYAKAGPSTDEEVGEAIGHPRIWPRCSELRSMGLIAPTGETRIVERTQQEADCCDLTPAGRNALAAMGVEA